MDMLLVILFCVLSVGAPFAITFRLLAPFNPENRQS